MMAAKPTVKPLTTYALFSGAGGLHLGLEQIGFDIAVASDISNHAAETHQRNRPNIPFICEDARKLSGARLLKAAGGKKPDLIVGGPPCQGFSTLGDKMSADPRNELFGAFARIVDELSPHFILMENVKSLTTMYDGRFKDHILETFKNLGYTMHWSVLDAADYGVPQVRKRVLFFGTRHGAQFQFPAPTHGPLTKNPYRTTGEAIGDLVKKGTEIPNHIALSHSEIVIKRYKLIPEGGRLPPPNELPPDIRRGNFGNTYKRLHRKQPALTMVPGNNAFPIHPTLHRSLTPREAARLQTFPDDIIFEGDRRSQCILVGNAVPPMLAAAVGRSILIHSRSAPTKQQTLVDTLTIPAARKKPTISRINAGFIDLFCGAGGITVGLERAGWTPQLGVDLNKYATITHQAVFPHVKHMEADISDKKVRKAIIDAASGQEVGIVAGGPPCQGFSIFGKRRFVNTRGYKPHDDPRNKLVYSFLDIVQRVSPRWFIMENVPGLVNLDNGLFLNALMEEFKSAGYEQCEARVLNAADYGVPQLRRRLIIIGNRTGHIIPWPKKKYFGEPKDWQDPYRTVGEVISDLATAKSHEKFTCHVAMNHKPLLVERYKYIPEGGRLDLEALPERLRTGYRTDIVKNYSHVFKRLHRERPAFTMVPGHNAFPIHPWLNRALTVREAARIQTFPDSIEFMGPRQEQCIQVGNAFPPLLAEIIGNNIRKAEVNGWLPGKVPASAYYSLIERGESPVDIEPEELEAVA
jgi:DNA (cytosine-5)-methyltransferase 1